MSRAVILIAGIVFFSRAMQNEQSMQIKLSHINNPDLFALEQIANARGLHLEHQCKNHSSSKIRISVKDIILGYDQLDMLIKKEIGIGLGFLNAEVKKTSRQLLDKSSKNSVLSDDQQFLITQQDHTNMLASVEEIDPFTKDSCRLLSIDLQKDIYNRLYRVYEAMRQRPHFLYALYLWSIDHKKIKDDQAILFRDIMQAWTSNYPDLKKNDHTCIIL